MSGKKLHVACSPLTGNIYAGTVLKNGFTWSANKQDVTNEAIIAVAQHAMQFKEKTGKELTLIGKGVPNLVITVTEESNE